MVNFQPYTATRQNRIYALNLYRDFILTGAKPIRARHRDESNAAIIGFAPVNK